MQHNLKLFTYRLRKRAYYSPFPAIGILNNLILAFVSTHSRLGYVLPAVGRRRDDPGKLVMGSALARSLQNTIDVETQSFWRTVIKSEYIFLCSD